MVMGLFRKATGKADATNCQVMETMMVVTKAAWNWKPRLGKAWAPSDSKDVLPTPRLTNVHGGDGGNNEEKGNNGELMSNMNPGGSVHYPLREARKSCGRREQFHARSMAIGRKCVCVG